MESEAKKMKDPISKMKVQKRRKQNGSCSNTNEAATTQARKAVGNRKNDWFIVCERCGKKCASQKKLTLHRCSAWKKECSKCQRMFSCVATLNKHMITMHGQSRSQTTRDNLNDSTTCTACRKVFASKESLVSHMNMHDDDTKATAMSSFLCGQCGKFFKTQEGVNRHIAQVHDDAKIISEYISNGHMGITEGGSSQITCPICGENFKKFIRYLYHVKVHLEANDSCDLATRKQLEGLLEKFSDTLRRTGDFPCKFCSKTFYYRPDLVTHMHDHNNTTYECPHCDKIFYARSTQKVHLQTHKERYNFSCSLCSKMFVHEVRGFKHCRIGHGSEQAQLITVNPVENSTKCTTCNKTFPTSYNLKVHIRTHTKEKLHQCPVCTKSYTDPSNLNHHGKNSHPEHPQELFRRKRKVKLKPGLPSEVEMCRAVDST